MSKPQKYRKKPVVVDAMQFDGSAQSAGEIIRWVNSNGGQATLDQGKTLVIHTMEGPMSGPSGWWVIRGIKGEFYPCEGEVFDGSYDLEPIECAVCHRERTPGDADYNPMQVILGQPLGWYSGDDGEICPEDMAEMLRKQ